MSPALSWQVGTLRGPQTFLFGLRPKPGARVRGFGTVCLQVPATCQPYSCRAVLFFCRHTAGPPQAHRPYHMPPIQLSRSAAPPRAHRQPDPKRFLFGNKQVMSKPFRKAVWRSSRHACVRRSPEFADASSSGAYLHMLQCHKKQRKDAWLTSSSTQIQTIHAVWPTKRNSTGLFKLAKRS